MTLREKFDEVFIENWLADYAEECEKITDEFAIGFSLWKEANVVQDDNDMYYNESRIQVSRNNPVDIHQLLKIYKKEKGL
jgi:hypothetical protein